MIQIWCTNLGHTLPAHLFDYYLRQMPLPIRERLNRQRIRQQKANASLLGHVLLAEALKCNHMPVGIHDLLYSVEGRPYLNPQIDFNISHSEEYVVCALSTQHRLGIDIEYIKPVELENKSWCFNPQEWQQIQLAPEPIRQFYGFWTQKEAAVKADGRGLSFALSDVTIHGQQVQVAGNFWNVQQISLASDYIVSMAIDQPDTAYSKHYFP